MTRTRRKRWKGFAAGILVAAGAAATVAIAHSAAGLVTKGMTVPEMADAPAERCTRYAALSLASSHGIRQGRVEETEKHRVLVVGSLKGTAVRMTLENTPDACRVVRVDTL